MSAQVVTYWFWTLYRRLGMEGVPANQDAGRLSHVGHGASRLLVVGLCAMCGLGTAFILADGTAVHRRV
jgi:hypothetical protein